MVRFSAKVTSKGQITLPAPLRQRLNVKAGDRIDFTEGANGNIEIVARTKTLADLRGILPYDGPPLSSSDFVKLVEGARASRADTIVKRLAKSRR